MSNDNEVKVKITGESASAEAAMAKATLAVSSGTTTMRESMNALTSLFEGLQSKMLLVAGVLAGGKAFKESVDKVVELNGQAVQLSRTLGITAEEANVLNTALGNVFLDKDTYLDASRQITKQINSNGGAFKELGVATKDAQGKLLPMQQIISNVATKLNEYKEGADRNIIANRLMGKSYEDVIKLQKLTPEVMREAAQEVRDYHKELNPEAVLKYRQAMENVGDVLEGVQIAIGKAVMPVLTELGEWFSSMGPALVEVFAESLNILKIGFDTVKFVVVTLYDAFNSFVDSFLEGISRAFGGETLSKLEFFKNMVKVVELAFTGLAYAIELSVEGISATLDLGKTYLFAFADTAMHALKGDFAGAKAAWNHGLNEIFSVVEIHAKKIAELNAKYAAKANEIILPSVVAPSKTDKKQGGDKEAGSEGSKKQEEKTRTNDWALELQNTKEAYELQNNLRKYDIQQEVDYWNQRLAQAAVGTKEYSEITKKLNDAKLKQAQEAQKQAADLSAIEIDRVKASAGSQLAIDEENARAQLDLGQITHSQYLEMEQAFEDRRYAIAKAAIEARMQLIGPDNPVEKAKLDAELEALAGEHALKLNAINIETVKESHQLWEDLSDSMSSLWDKGLDAMMNGTLKWSNAYKAVLASVGKVFASFLADKAKHWLQTEVLQTAFTKAQTLIRSVLTKVGLITDTTATTAAAGVKISAEAAAAGAGAAASQAAIPVIGPGLALAAMGAMMVAVMGLKGSIKSARNGYDIPAGVNPMVQLHEQEMVLPKAQADAVRGMANGGGMGGGAIHLHVHAVDGQSVKKLFSDHSHHLADALRQQFRNGGPLPS